MSLTHYEAVSTAKTRQALGIQSIDDSQGLPSTRVSSIIVSRKLRPITKLSGKAFLSTWWQIVVCHYILWKNDVHHCNVSPSNLVVYKTSDGRAIGVLNDFDLSSPRDSSPGQERTGTIPFMALDLLVQEAIEGKVKHLYQHDAESFIWVLIWISMCYERGMFIGKGTPLNAWLKVDAIGCHKEKSSFLLSGRKIVKPAPSQKDNWKVAQSCLRPIRSYYMDSDSDSENSDSEPDALPDTVVFQTWFVKQIRKARTRSPELELLLDVRF